MSDDTSDSSTMLGPTTDGVNSSTTTSATPTDNDGDGDAVLGAISKYAMAIHNDSKLNQNKSQ